MEFYSVQEQEAGLGAGPHHDISWEDERPPTYNPEDYSAHLTRSGLSLNINHHLFICHETLSLSRFTETSGSREGGLEHTADVFSYEMGLRQFRSVSDLMGKLMYDLQVSYDSFLTEFIRFPNNGVTKLCDLLKVIQLSQTNHKSASHGSIRSVQSDEFQTLLCLKVVKTCAL